MKMKFGAIVVDGRNKIGGHVASKNRGGSYLRTKVTPVNPQTVAQAGVRNNMTSNAQAWRGLTQAQRDSFNAAVGDYSRTDIFGDIRNPSGFNLFVKLNQNLRNASASPITVAPMPVDVGALTALTVTASSITPEIDLTMSPGTVPTDRTLIIEATPCVSQGRSFVKNQYRKIHQIAAAGNTTVDVISQWSAKFGSLVPGTKIFIRCKLVATTTGQVSQYVSQSAIVA